MHVIAGQFFFRISVGPNEPRGNHSSLQANALKGQAVHSLAWRLLLVAQCEDGDQVAIHGFC